MEIVTVKFEEAEPATFPTLTVYDGDDQPNEEPIVIDRPIWLRLESWIAYRWTPRQCVWTFNGCGEWSPHVAPASNLTVDVWDSDTFTWSAYTPQQTAVGGYYFPQVGTYRVTGTVGDNAGDVPQVVTEAYMRLKAYHDKAETSGTPAGVASHSLKLGDGYDETVIRNPNYIARSLHYSGSADLLRSYRRI